MIQQRHEQISKLLDDSARPKLDGKTGLVNILLYQRVYNPPDYTNIILDNFTSAQSEHSMITFITIVFCSK